MRVISDARDPNADIWMPKIFALESGKPGVVRA
jgi:hypothetical protein